MSESIKPKITAAFRILRKHGFFARQNWSCCQGCGCSELPDGTTKYVFYHRQDGETLNRIGEVNLSWGTVVYRRKPSKEKLESIGKEVVNALRAKGLTVEWNGKSDRRITVKG